MEKKKRQDKEMRQNRRTSGRRLDEKIKIKQLSKRKLAKYLINDLKNYGPSGLIHMNALSSVIGRPIRIWQPGGRLYRTINGKKNQNSSRRPVDVEYHKQASNYIGHWTLLGNKDPVNVEIDLNSCLFAVIAAQIGKNTSDLRADIIDYFLNNKKDLFRQIDHFLHSNDNKTSLMIGGVRYIGTSDSDAAVILDNSQNALCYGCKAYGHPRGHASHADAVGPMDSVENYSRSSRGWKSGFLSRQDQDNVAHIALNHERAQQAMVDLNNGRTSEAVTFSRRELQTNSYELPKMKEYCNGNECTGELDIIRVTLVLRHHKDTYRDRNADVFVHTLYPRCS